MHEQYAPWLMLGLTIYTDENKGLLLRLTVKMRTRPARPIICPDNLGWDSRRRFGSMRC